MQAYCINTSGWKCQRHSFDLGWNQTSSAVQDAAPTSNSTF